MIIDAHFHIFPPLGRASVEEDPLQPLRMKFWQCHMRDSTRFRRKADDELVPEPFLQWDSDDINEMPEVSFRMADFGRAEITAALVKQHRGTGAGSVSETYSLRSAGGCLP